MFWCCGGVGVGVGEFEMGGKCGFEFNINRVRLDLLNTGVRLGTDDRLKCHQSMYPHYDVTGYTYLADCNVDSNSKPWEL